MLNQPPIVVGMGGGDKQQALSVAGCSFEGEEWHADEADGAD
jgi:hypothetical protein